MSAQQQVEEVMDEVATLEFTQRTRKTILTTLLAQTSIYNDPKSLKVATGVLADMDKNALGKLRIKIEESASKNNAATHDLIAAVLQKIPSSRSFEVETSSPRAAPTLGPDVPDPVLVEGEDAIGVNAATYSTFMEKRADPGVEILL